MQLESSTAHPPAIRRILNKYRDRIIRRFKQLLYHSSELGGMDVQGLKDDIKVILDHVFCNHEHCRTQTCQSAGDTSAIPTTYIQLQQSSLMQPLINLINDLVLKANRLRMNYTTNKAESAFGLLNKFNLGKRVDLASRGEFHRRCIIASLQWNDHFWFPKWFKNATGFECGKCSIISFHNTVVFF